MGIFVQATAAPAAKTDTARKISFVYAALLVVFAVAQLFTFDEFLELFASFGLPASEGLAFSIAPAIVVSEVFALPFLLRMRLSPAFRFLSMGLGWLVAILWLFVSYWVTTMHPDAMTVGFLGTVIDLTPGWWTVLVSAALGILAAWASWGLWPGKREPAQK